MPARSPTFWPTARESREAAGDGAARRAARWRILFLSSGEIGLADKVAEDGRGRRLAAGQQVRIVDLPADAGAGFGLFEDLHGFASPEALARHLRGASASQYGVAVRAFLDRVAGDLEAIRKAVGEHTARFIGRHVPEGSDGQVQRVAQRFALIAAGGELAAAAGVLPWSPGEAVDAASRCFDDWLRGRGGTEPAETRDGLLQVRSFLLAHGMARFVPAWADPDQRVPPRDVAGYRKREGDGWDFYVTTSAWRDEVCCGFNPKSLAAVMAERGLLLVPEKGSHRAKAVAVPGLGKLRLYHIPARFLEGDSDD